MVSERKLRCSEEAYRALEIARNTIIGLKILKREIEMHADELKRIGQYERAMMYERSAGNLLKDIRHYEKEVADLETQCFGE